MATFATAADLNRAIPRPADGVATYRPQTAATEGAEAQYRQGQQTQEFAATLDKFAGELDETAAQDALNKLRTKRAELTYDPEKGFRRIQGGDMVNGKGPGGQPWMKELPEGFQKEVDNIGSGLLSPRARALYQRAAGAETLAFGRDLAIYAGDQNEKYQTAVDKDTHQQILASAAQNYEDPAAVTTLMDRAAGVADRTARRTGMPSQALAMRSNVARVAVESMLVTNPRQALAYFDSVKPQMDAADIVALQSKLKTTATDLNGENAANSALLNLGLPPVASDAPGGGASVDNNVGNIVVSKFNYAGGKGAPKGAFETFVTPEHGVAAAYQTIQAKAKQNGGSLSFVDLIGGNGKVQGWAPADDGKDPMLKGNNPKAYAAQLANAVGLSPTDAIPLDDPEKMAAVLKRMNQVEKGKQTVPDASFVGGIRLAKGESPNPIPRDATQAPVFKGDVVMAYQKAANDIANRTDLPPAEKAKALALITQTRTQMEGIRAATVKSLDDYSQTVLTTAMLDPSNYKDGTLVDIAQRYEAAGEGAKATRFKVLAAMEGSLKTFATTASEGQRSMLGSVLEGLPKQVAEGLKKGDTEAKAQAKVRAGNLFTQAKESFGKGVNPEGLADSLKEAAGIYAALGDEERAREVHQFYDNAYKAHALNQQPTTAATQALADVKAAADQAGANSAALQAFDLMKQTYDRQQTELQKDPLAAGTRFYKDVGTLEPIDWTNPENIWQALDIRSTQARKVKELSGNETAPFTVEEMQRLRGVLDTGAPEMKKQLLRTLGRSLPDDLKTVTAVRLAGKTGEGDETSQMYASALARYGEGTPEGDAVADKILMGSQILAKGGEAGRKPASTSDAWQSALQDRLGNALALHFGDRVPAELASAIKAHYVASMWASGKQGEKTDEGVLDKSIQAVTGGIITYRGQQLFAPSQNATSYDIDAALGTLTSGDVPANLRTQEGDQITADAIRRNGRLLSVGAGIYAVRIPDPRAGGDLRPIKDPNTGDAFVLDLRPLLERAKDAQPAIPLTIFNP